MDLEILLLALILVGALLTWWSRASGRFLLTLCLWGAGSAAILAAALHYRRPLLEAELPVSDRPIAVPGDGYVSSAACRACHPSEYASWAGSYHRRMTQVAGPQTVLGDFDDVQLEHRGQRYGLRRDGERFLVEMADPEFPGLKSFEEPPRVEREVVLLTGSHHFQTFWFPSGHSRRLDLFEFVYRIPEQRWMPLDAAFLVPPEENQLTGMGRWNAACNKCHATHVTPRIFSKDNMDTLVAEFGIACEACHGPGEEHIRRHQAPQKRYQQHLTALDDDSMVNPEDLDPVRRSQVCGQCHGVNELRDPAAYEDYRIHGLTYRPGDDLMETRIIKETHEHKFWPDGMIRVSGREYNGLLKSPCYEHGDEARGILTCLSCHQLHPHADDPRPLSEWANDQLTADGHSDAACTQCHSDFLDLDRLTSHTHHDAASSGSSCYNCHMPHTTYGLLKSIRSHQISSPSVQNSLDTGRPNACNLCHLDQTMAWAADRLAEWYGAPSFAELQVPKGMVQDLESVSAALLWLLRGDAGQRALTVWSMGWQPAQETSGTHWMAPHVSQLLMDPYNAVRFLAYQTLQSLPGFEELEVDFMGPISQRQQAARGVVRRWLQFPREGDLSSRVLFDDQGKVRRDELGRLLRMRNNRPVFLTE